MATVTSSIEQFPSADLLSDLCDEGEITLPTGDLSKRTEELAGGIISESSSPSPTKRVYFWVKAQEGDEAFRGEEMDNEREMNISMFRKIGYEVVVFKTNRAFFDHIKKDPSKVDLLVISDHGTPYRVGDLWVKSEAIISTDMDLSEEERASGFQSLRAIMNEDSILLFDACLAGNKTIERNIAKVASEILPQTTVYGSQHVTEYEPGYMFKADKDGKPVIEKIYYGNRADGESMVKPVMPSMYRNGVELSNEKPVEIPPELFAKPKPKGYNPYAVGAVIFTIAVAIGVGASYFGVLPTFSLPSLTNGLV